MILSAHWTAAATIDLVRGLSRVSNRSSLVFRCRATRIPAMMPMTLFLPSSMPSCYIFAFCSSSLSLALAEHSGKEAACKDNGEKTSLSGDPGFMFLFSGVGIIHVNTHWVKSPSQTRLLLSARRSPAHCSSSCNWPFHLHSDTPVSNGFWNSGTD